MNTRLVKLTEGYKAKISNGDYPVVSLFKWHVCGGKTGKRLYARTAVQVNGKRYRIWMHRLISNAPKNMVVDHINRDSLDNRRSNLRVCTLSQNNMNRLLYIKNNIEDKKYKGVYPCKQTKKYLAKLRKAGKEIYLGYFTSQKEAARAYNISAIKYFGEFARLNVLDGEDG